MPVRLAAAVAGAATTAIAASSSASTSSRGAAMSPDRRRRRRRQIRGATTIDDAAQNSCSDDADDGEKAQKQDAGIGAPAVPPMSGEDVLESDAGNDDDAPSADDHPDDVFRESCSDHIIMEQPSHEQVQEQERTHTCSHDGAPNSATDECPEKRDERVVAENAVGVAASSTQSTPDPVDGSSAEEMAKLVNVEDDREGCNGNGETDDVQDEDECAAYDSSFDDGGDDGDDETSRNDEDSGSTDIDKDTDVDKDDKDSAADKDANTTPPSSENLATTTAITSTSVVSTGTAATAMQSIQYTSRTIASSASYAVTTALPLAAGELVTSSLRRVVHSAKLVYSNRTWVGQYRQHSDLASGVGGYYRDDVVWDIGSALLADGRDGSTCSGSVRNNAANDSQQSSTSDPHISLPPFSSLPWIDRQLVKEWRTYDLSNLVDSATVASTEEPRLDEHDDILVGDGADNKIDDDDADDDDHDYVSARTLIPAPLTRPPRENAKSCHYCDRHFGPTLHRHHCRLCGRSCCHPHSDATHSLPHLGYDPNVAERVCFRCKSILEERNLAERIAWRLARLRDYLDGDLVPYFVTGVDTMEDAAVRLTRAAIAMARKIPLGAQATVAVETLEVLRKHGLKGVYGLILRKEFMAAADLLCQACGINRKVWPLSVHELSAAIFYALAHHRMVRGMDPEGEHRIHALRDEKDHGLMDGDETLLEEDEVADSSPTWSDLAGLPRGASLGSLTTLHERGEISGIDSDGRNDPHSSSGLIDEVDVSDPADDGVHESLAAKSGDCSGIQERQGNLLDDTLPQRRIRPLVPVCETASDSLIASLLFYAPLALNFIYATSDVDIQLLAAQQGWRLLYAHLDQSGGCHASSSSSSTAETASPMIEDTDKEKKLVADRPAFALLARSDQKLACLAIRGTATINDVVTDIRAVPVPFPPEDEAGGSRRKSADGDGDETDWTSIASAQGLALCGMARAAINLYRENIDALVVLATKGYRIRIVGHSLGGGVSALLGALVRRHLKTVFNADVENGSMILDAVLRVYGYGTPACADAALADDAASYVTSCVLHDDVVPRLTATSIRGLLKHLLFVRETWVKDHLSADISAYAERARGAWAPRWRQSFTLIKSKSQKQIGKAKKVYREYKESVTGSSASSDSAHDINLRDDTFDKAEGGIDEAPIDSTISDGEHEEEKDVIESNLSQSKALEIDGDLFYEAEQDMIESDTEEDDNEEGIVAALDALTPGEPSNVAIPEESELESGNDDGAAPAVMLEETPLPRMFIPGKIVHIYTHRGAYKATEVPRKFRELRHISLAGNMLSDHLARQYYEALLEVRSVRRARAPLPEWTGFGEESTCACCASRFTWASTSDTEAQEARDKHNCRKCGGLVCNPCSQNHLPLPELGITVPSRVCDRCYNDLGGVISDGLGEEQMSRSFLAEKDSTGHKGMTNAKQGVGINPHKENNVAGSGRQRRSVVVDELASRIPSVSLDS